MHLWNRWRLVVDIVKNTPARRPSKEHRSSLRPGIIRNLSKPVGRRIERVDVPMHEHEQPVAAACDPEEPAVDIGGFHAAGLDCHEISPRIGPLATAPLHGVAAVEGLFGLGPVPAVRKALERPTGRLATSSGSRSTRPSPLCRSPLLANSAYQRISSTWKAALSRTVTRSAQLERSSRRDSFIQ